jgi:hypothetical protein
MSYLRYVCLFGSSLPPVVFRKVHVLFTLCVFVLLVFTSHNVNKTRAFLQTTGSIDEPNKHK